MALPTFEKKRLIGVVCALSFGLTSLFAVLEFGVLIPATFVFGFFVLLPLILILGEDFPLVAAADESADAAGRIDGFSTEEQPIARLRERYASGEIDDEEFERRLDRLLVTEDLDERFERTASGRSEAAVERELE